MKKPLILTCIAVLSACGLFAQTEEEKWSVYDLQTQQETVMDLTGFVPAAIVGRDERTNITGRATDFEKAGVVLEMKSKKGMSLCSGSMIGPNIVLTAAHCLTSGKNFMESVQVFATGLEGNAQPPSSNPHRRTPKKPNQGRRNKKTPKKPLSPQDILNVLKQKSTLTDAVTRQADASLAAARTGFPSANAVKIWVPQEWRKANSSDGTVDLQKAEPYDFGIIVLDSNLGDKTGWMKLASKSTSELKNKKIILLGRGGDKPSRTLWKAEGYVGKVDKLYLYHNADMVGGNSGGPIVLQSDPYTIVALNNFDFTQNNKPYGSFPNGGLRLSKQIINAVRQTSK